jgi:hypothetical protein
MDDTLSEEFTLMDVAYIYRWRRVNVARKLVYVCGHLMIGGDQTIFFWSSKNICVYVVVNDDVGITDFFCQKNSKV